MHQHVIAAAQTAAQVSPGDRHALGIGAFVVIVAFGAWASRKKKPAASN